MILIEKLLSKENVNAFRRQLDQVPWVDGKGTAEGMAAAVKTNAQTDENDPVVKGLTNDLLARLGNHSKFISGALPHQIFPPCFNRYREGETYGFHVDAAIMRIPHTNQVLRSDMSMTVFLSEADEYDGGELEIKSEFGNKLVKAEAGDAILYPSSSLHRVRPVTRGIRVAAITWVQSLVPDAMMRQTLFDLDQSIQALVHNPTINRAQLDQLHHVYHNLVRQHSLI